MSRFGNILRLQEAAREPPSASVLVVTPGVCVYFLR